MGRLPQKGGPQRFRRKGAALAEIGAAYEREKGLFDLPVFAQGSLEQQETQRMSQVLAWACHSVAMSCLLRQEG